MRHLKEGGGELVWDSEEHLVGLHRETNRLFLPSHFPVYAPRFVLS